MGRTGSEQRRVTVLGAGVVGLSIAHELAAGGAAVTVVADRSARQSVSAVAAAVWFPYGAESSPAVASWLARAYDRFARLAADPGTGVDMRAGTVVERGAADRSWAAAVPGHREARPDELPAGASSGVRATVPVITMDPYLRWLQEQCTELGVGFRRRSVAALGELVGEADLVVVAAGLRSGALLGDGSVYPVRGQVVRLANPGLTEWVTDEAHPGGLTYVVPRRGDIVCGGTAEAGSWDEGVHPGTEDAILRRATALVPELAGLPVLSRAAGLRPARPCVRLENVPGLEIPVIACYGHGGAGVTLSWGCAEAVTRLVM